MKLTTLTRSAHRPWLFVLAFGIGLSALLGSGLLAVVADVGSSDQNNLASGSFSQVKNLELALTSVSNANCGGVTWTTNVGPATVGNLDLEAGTIALSTKQRICARTTRGGTYRLTMGLRSVFDTETGCSASAAPEISKDSDSCGNGTGELSRVVKVGGDAQGSGDAAGCNGLISLTLLKNVNLDQGGHSFALCTISAANAPVSFIPDVRVDQAAANGDLAAAQSDRVQFEYVFSLEQ
ncbi:MAG: hypothetical protein QOI61_807 [Actinomycetota bacterium]